MQCGRVALVAAGWNLQHVRLDILIEVVHCSRSYYYVHLRRLLAAGLAANLLSNHKPDTDLSSSSSARVILKHNH